MATIPVAPIPKRKIKSRELLAEFCYYYSRYSFQEAKLLPAKDVFLLLNKARQKDAERYLHLTQIAAAPHTKKGRGVKKLINQYQRIINSGK